MWARQDQPRGWQEMNQWDPGGKRWVKRRLHAPHGGTEAVSTSIARLIPLV